MKNIILNMRSSATCYCVEKLWKKKNIKVNLCFAGVSPAGQLSAGQRCAAALRCPWTPSDSVWTARCYMMRWRRGQGKKRVYKINRKKASPSFWLRENCCMSVHDPYLAPGVLISRFLSFSSSARIATRVLFGKAGWRKKKRKRQQDSRGRERDGTIYSISQHHFI